jgi:predicted transposase/invertase (TIGR01784 family)
LATISLETEVVSDLLASGRITRVYLDELGQIDELPIGLRLILLTTFEDDLAVTAARSLIERTGTEPNQRAIINLVSTIIVYKFTDLTRDEVDAMLGIELSQTRVYQEAKAEGIVEGRVEGIVEGRIEGRIEEGQSLIIKLLTRKVGKLSVALQKEIRNLSIDQIESLGEALLDFSTIADLKAWLTTAKPKSE